MKGSNWFARPSDGSDLEAAWKADIALLALNGNDPRFTPVSRRQTVYFQ